MQHLQTVNLMRKMASLMMLQKQNRRRRLRRSGVAQSQHRLNDVPPPLRCCDSGAVLRATSHLLPLALQNQSAFQKICTSSPQLRHVVRQRSGVMR
jgi:hypothetical protein